MGSSGATISLRSQDGVGGGDRALPLIPDAAVVGAWAGTDAEDASDERLGWPFVPLTGVRSTSARLVLTTRDARAARVRPMTPEEVFRVVLVLVLDTADVHEEDALDFAVLLAFSLPLLLPRPGALSISFELNTA